MSFDYSLASLDFALFWISRWPPLVRGGAEGSVQSNHCEGTVRRVRLRAVSLYPKRLVSRKNVQPECHARPRFCGHTHHACAITMEESATLFRFLLGALRTSCRVLTGRVCDSWRAILGGAVSRLLW